MHFVAPAGAVLPEVLASLRREAPRLRAEVARGVSRKRAPELSFVPAWQAADADVEPAPAPLHAWSWHP